MIKFHYIISSPLTVGKPCPARFPNSNPLSAKGRPPGRSGFHWSVFCSRDLPRRSQPKRFRTPRAASETRGRERWDRNWQGTANGKKECAAFFHQFLPTASIPSAKRAAGLPVFHQCTGICPLPSPFCMPGAGQPSPMAAKALSAAGCLRCPLPASSRAAVPLLSWAWKEDGCPSS